MLMGKAGVLIRGYYPRRSFLLIRVLFCDRQGLCGRPCMLRGIFSLNVFMGSDELSGVG